MMTQDLHTLTGPYALDALPPEEAVLFEEHLDECRTCRAEVAEFRATATRLADAVATTPPAGMRDAVLDQIAVTRQEPPKIVQLPLPAVSRLRRYAMPAAAAITVIAVGLAVALSSLTGRVSDLELREQTINAVLGSDDAQLLRSSGNGSTASAVASASRGEAVISIAGLEQAPDDMIYELWLIGANGAEPMGLFDTDANGTAVALLRGDMSAAQAIAVTVEPAGGSDVPTSAPFLRIDLMA